MENIKNIKGIFAAIVVYPKYQGFDLLILGLYYYFYLN